MISNTNLYYVWRIGSQLSYNTNANAWGPINSEYSGIEYGNHIMFYSAGNGDNENDNQYHLTNNCGWYGCRTMQLDSVGSIELHHGNAFPNGESNEPSFVSFEIIKV